MTAEVTTDPPGQAPGGSARMFPKDVAEAAGIKAVATIHKYNSTAKRNRLAGQPGPRDMPAPDGHETTRHGPPSPYWYPGTIDPWLQARWNPGRPTSGGTESARPSPKPRARAGRQPGKKKSKTRAAG